MEMAKMKIVNVPVDEITPYENNPRINEGAVEQLARIIEQLGFRNPAVLNKDKVVIEGHTRLLAVKKLGWKTMPCIIATDLTPEQEQALRIADNKIAEIAEWDDDKLKVELAALQEAGFDLSLLAFGDDELEDLLRDDTGTHGETEPDAVPETPEVPVSTPAGGAGLDAGRGVPAWPAHTRLRRLDATRRRREGVRRGRGRPLAHRPAVQRGLPRLGRPVDTQRLDGGHEVPRVPAQGVRLRGEAAEARRLVLRLPRRLGGLQLPGRVL